MVGSAWMALALLAAFSVAEASGGRISFSGAVVEPTCSVPTHDLAASLPGPAAHPSSPLRLVCGRTATDPGRPYSRVVLDLDTARGADDRLLNYMIRRASPASAGGTSYKLVVRTYD